MSSNARSSGEMQMTSSTVNNPTETTLHVSVECVSRSQENRQNKSDVDSKVDSVSEDSQGGKGPSNSSGPKKTSLRTERQGPGIRLRDRKDSRKNDAVPLASRTDDIATGQTASRKRSSHQLTVTTLPVTKKLKGLRVSEEILPRDNRNPAHRYAKGFLVDPEEIIVHDKEKQLAAQLKSSTNEIYVKDIHCDFLQANVEALKAANAKLELKVVKMQQQLCAERAGLDGSYVDGRQSPFLLESAAKEVFSAIAAFTSMYAKYTRLDSSLPARSLLGVVLPRLNSVNAYITRENHWIMLLKSVICHCLFQNFENETFIPFNEYRNTALFLNHEERVRHCFGYFKGSNSVNIAPPTICGVGDHKVRFDSLWSDYLASTSSAILAPEILGLVQFFTEDGEYTEVEDGKSSRSACSPCRAHSFSLVRSFYLAAKRVFNFHKLCLSFEPRATIFRVAVGDPFNGEYMDSVVTLEDDNSFVPKVGFMIYPGFRLRKSVIKCLVYLGV